MFDDNRITLHQQAIIPTYRLDCLDKDMCGNITKWGLDVHRGGAIAQYTYSLDLQVWRPSPTVDDSIGAGYYSLVGSNKFGNIPLNSGVVVVTPSPQDYIQFRSGDVLGFYVEEAAGSNDGVVILSYPSSFTSELVWYASLTATASQNGYSIGSNGVLNTLTRAAPVISIDTGSVTRPCRSLIVNLKCYCFLLI